jgi:LacI family transcriptional regulator
LILNIFNTIETKAYQINRNFEFIAFFSTMKSSQITLKDIAKQLGITVSTVSRALKGYPDISPETKKTVLELAEKLHYRPNPIALNLRKNRSYSIGVIIPEVVHYFFSTVISGIVETADEAGYSVILCQTNESYHREVREAGVLLSSRVDGLLISLANETKQYEHLQEFLDLNIPLVMFDKICDSLDTSKVVVDDFEGSMKAVEHLIQQGYKRIAHIRGPFGPSNAEERLKGYLEALKKHNLPIDEQLIFPCERVSYEEGYAFVKTMLHFQEPPDAIFAVADWVAIGALQAIKDEGIRIPEQMGIIGFSDWRMCTIVEPALSSIYQPGFQMGKIATQILLEEIENNHQKLPNNLVTETLETSLMIRKSSLKDWGV